MTQLDIPRVAEIHVFAQRDVYRGAVPDSFLFGKMSVAARMKYFADSKYEGFVYDDGFVKAFHTMGPCEDDDKNQDADKIRSFELYRIFVDRFFAGEGIGGLLASHCEDIAKSRNYDEVCLWALECNTGAQAFYRKIGYVPDGAQRMSGYFDVPEVRFVKTI